MSQLRALLHAQVALSELTLPLLELLHAHPVLVVTMLQQLAQPVATRVSQGREDVSNYAFFFFSFISSVAITEEVVKTDLSISF